MMTLSPSHDAASALRATFSGTILEPGDPDYDDARRLWNGMIDLRPSLIVRPHRAEGVATAVRVAREHGLRIAVRGGQRRGPDRNDRLAVGFTRDRTAPPLPAVLT